MSLHSGLGDDGSRVPGSPSRRLSPVDDRPSSGTDETERRPDAPRMDPSDVEEIERLHAETLRASQDCDRDPAQPLHRERLRQALRAELELLETFGFDSYAACIAAARDARSRDDPPSAGPPRGRIDRSSADPELERLQHALELVTEELRVSRSEADHLRAALEVRKAELDGQRSELRDVQTGLEDERADVTWSRVEIEQERARLDDGRAELESARARFERDIAESAAVRAQLDAEARASAERVLATAEQEAAELVRRTQREAAEIRAEATVTAEGIRRLTEYQRTTPDETTYGLLPGPALGGSGFAATPEHPDEPDRRNEERAPVVVEAPDEHESAARGSAAREVAEVEARLERLRAKRARLKERATRQRRQLERDRIEATREVGQAYADAARLRRDAEIEVEQTRACAREELAVELTEKRVQLAALRASIESVLDGASALPDILSSVRRAVGGDD